MAQWLTVTHSLSSRGVGALLWPLPAPSMHVAHTNMQTNTHTHKTEINKSFFKLMRNGPSM